jgi:glycosyltransferase involved in cell wall biosynthesis
MTQTTKHIFQISKDTSLLNGNKKNESYQRQLDYLNNLKEKAGQDAKMTIIVLARNSKKSSNSDNGLNIVAISASFWVRFFGIFFTIYKINKSTPITVLTTQAPIDEGWTTLLFGKIFRIPVIAQIHFDIFDKMAMSQILGEGIKGKIRYTIFKNTIKYHTKIRVVGNSIVKNLVDKCSCTPEQIILLPVMVPLLNNIIEFAKNNNSNKPFRVIYVGRLVEQKNLLFLLKIASETIKIDCSILFDIVGNGPLRLELEEKCLNLGIQNNVIFHGEIANNDLPKFYQNADLFLLTSYYEGFGRVIIEAGAYKLPVLSTNVTGPEDIIEDNYNGYLLELDDKKGFVEKIIYLKNKPAKRINMGSNNYKLVHEKYNVNRLKDEWINLLVKI